jgi:hypothetical protein
MDDLQSTIAAGGDDAYLIFGFIHEEDGARIRAGGSEGLRRFLYWFEVVKQAGNKQILELFLWKFFVYLPDISRRIVIEKFRREGLTWEVKQIETAARCRGQPSEEELSSPRAKHTRWVSSADEEATRQAVRTGRASSKSILLIPLVALVSFIAVSLVSLAQGRGLWPGLLQGSAELYGAIVRQPLQSLIGLVYPANWRDVPVWAYDVLVLWSFLYICFLIFDLLGKREILAIMDIWGVGPRNHRASAAGSGLRGILRHGLAFLMGPFFLIMLFASYLKLKKDHRRRVSDFHINTFKVHLISHGISLTRFDDGIEAESFARRREAEFQAGQTAVLRAALLYLSPVLVLLTAIPVTLALYLW